MLKKYVSILLNFLVINVCNQGKTLCSHCTKKAWKKVYCKSGFCDKTITFVLKYQPWQIYNMHPVAILP